VELSISESIGVKTGWKQKTVQKAKIESWSSFGFQYSKEGDVYVFFFFFETSMALENYRRNPLGWACWSST
jgi:hypothetical protein